MDSVREVEVEFPSYMAVVETSTWTSRAFICRVSRSVNDIESKFGFQPVSSSLPLQNVVLL